MSNDIGKHMKRFQRYMDKGWDIETPDWLGYTPLECAISRMNGRMHQAFEETIALILLGADIEPVKYDPNNLRDRESPLMEAAKRGRLTLCEQLIKRGATVNYMTSCGNSPLQLASYYDHPRTCFLLLKNGADPNQFLTERKLITGNMKTWPPLLLALYHNRETLVMHLIQRKAHVTEEIKAQAMQILEWKFEKCHRLSDCFSEAFTFEKNRRPS